MKSTLLYELRSFCDAQVQQRDCIGKRLVLTPSRSGRRWESSFITVLSRPLNLVLIVISFGRVEMPTYPRRCYGGGNCREVHL